MPTLTAFSAQRQLQAANADPRADQRPEMEPDVRLLVRQAVRPQAAGHRDHRLGLHPPAHQRLPRRGAHRAERSRAGRLARVVLPVGAKRGAVADGPPQPAGPAGPAQHHVAPLRLGHVRVRPGGRAGAAGRGRRLHQQRGLIHQPAARHGHGHGPGRPGQPPALAQGHVAAGPAAGRAHGGPRQAGVLPAAAGHAGAAGAALALCGPRRLALHVHALAEPVQVAAPLLGPPRRPAKPLAPRRPVSYRDETYTLRKNAVLK